MSRLGIQILYLHFHSNKILFITTVNYPPKKMSDNTARIYNIKLNKYRK